MQVIPAIGVGASKFLRVRRIFSRISSNLPKKFWATFCENIFLWRPFLEWKKVFMWFCTCWGSIFSNQSTLDDNVFKSKQIGRHFCPYFPRVSPDFQRFCQGFHRFCPDFPRIFRFSGILPGFSPHQNFWGCTYTPGSYTTDIVKQTVIARSKSINMNWVLTTGLQKIWFLVPISSGGANARFAPPADAHGYDRVFTCFHNSSLGLNRHFFLIHLRWRIRQILLYWQNPFDFLWI